MDELKEIREACESIEEVTDSPYIYSKISGIRFALARLEAREAKKTVPLLMLKEVYGRGFALDGRVTDCEGIAARYGYEVTE